MFLIIILDRYEGDLAICEVDGKIKKLPRNSIEKNVSEGSVLKKQGNIYIEDINATQKLKAKIKNLQDELFG